MLIITIIIKPYFECACNNIVIIIKKMSIKNVIIFKLKTKTTKKNKAKRREGKSFQNNNNNNK